MVEVCNKSSTIPSGTAVKDLFRNPIGTKALSLLTKVSHFLAEQGIQSYLVGGFVRDVLLKRETADIDIALAADALEVAPKLAAAIGGKHVPLDEVNRIGRVVLTDEETSPSKVQWLLDLSSFEGSIEEDLGRRDFTINAMAVNLGEIERELGKGYTPATPSILIDPFGGCKDLRHGVIKAVAETVFGSDAARLLRAVHLATTLGFVIDAETEASIKRHSHLIANVAGERIREELLQLLAISQSRRVLPYLDELGLLTAIIPELTQTKGAEQPKEHVWDVFIHSIETVIAVDFLLRQGTWEYTNGKVMAIAPWSTILAEHFEMEVSHGSTRRTLLKLAALLHDIAKPQTKTVETTGRIRFLGHAQEGAATVVSILERLRFSNKEIRLIETAVKHHLRPLQMSQRGLPSHRAMYRYFRDTGDAGIDTMFLNLADHLATRGPQLDLAQWQEHAQMVEYVLAERLEHETLVIPPKLVDGHDLINIFGMNPGPKIGKVLEMVREAQASGELVDRQEALAYVGDLLTSPSFKRKWK